MAMSPRNFARLFRGDTGETLARFTERVQAKDARCKLEQADLPIETVAKECGFVSVERMRRTFQRLFNISPHDYRARFRSTLLN
jgi:transcriptional regulator GlxA family with amidase domain